MDGHRGIVEIVEAPEAYDLRLSGDVTKTQLGSFEGELHGQLPEGSFVFNSGEVIAGQRARVKVYMNSSGDWTGADAEAFIASLAFE